MHDFTYYNPVKVIMGRAAGAGIVGEMAARGVTRVLLLYGGGSIKANGVYDELASALSASGIEWCDCGGVKPNPILAKAREAVAIARDNDVQAVLAVGGGSVIDSAKAIAAGALYDGDLWDFFSGAAKVEAALPIFVVATVSATASDMNFTAVLTNETLKVKSGLHSSKFFPVATGIDPSVQASVPERQTVDGGIDTIAHVLEAYFDGAKGVEVQKEYCEGLVRSVIRLIPLLVADPSDYDARSQFAWAAANALNGTTNAGHPTRGDFASHAMGHALSARYDSVHGETLAVIMPAWLKYVYREDLETAVRFAERVFGVREGSDDERARAGIDRLREFFLSLGAPSTLRDLGVPREDLPVLADYVTRKGSPVGLLKKLERGDVLAIYESVY